MLVIQILSEQAVFKQKLQGNTFSITTELLLFGHHLFDKSRVEKRAIVLSFAASHKCIAPVSRLIATEDLVNT